MQDTEQVDLDRRSAGAVAAMSFSTRRIVLVLTFTTMIRRRKPYPRPSPRSGDKAWQAGAGP
jgi:hypothetical protein